MPSVLELLAGAEMLRLIASTLFENSGCTVQNGLFSRRRLLIVSPLTHDSPSSVGRCVLFEPCTLLGSGARMPLSKRPDRSAYTVTTSARPGH